MGTISNKGGDNAPSSWEQMFSRSFLNTVFMDASCYWDVYRLNANVKHMLCSFRNTSNPAAAHSYTNTHSCLAALSSGFAVEHSWGQEPLPFAGAGWTSVSLGRKLFPFGWHYLVHVQGLSRSILQGKQAWSFFIFSYSFLTYKNHRVWLEAVRTDSSTVWSNAPCYLWPRSGCVFSGSWPRSQRTETHLSYRLQMKQEHFIGANK